MSQLKILPIMAKKVTEPEEKPVRIPVYVAGHGVSDDGQVYVMFKDKVSKNPLYAVKDAQHHGSKYLAKGITLEEAKLHFPHGEDILELAWGEEIEHKKGYQNIYEVEEI